jgi:aminopeptidase
LHAKLEKHLKKNNLLELCYKHFKIFDKVYKDCLNENGEDILIIGDTGFKNRNLSPVLSYMNHLFCQDNGLKNKLIFQAPKNRTSSADSKVVKSILNLPKNSIIFTNISDRLGSLKSIGKSYRKFCREKGHRFISSTSLSGIYNTNLKKFIDAIDVDYKQMSKRHALLKNKIDQGNEIHVTTKKGTDLFIDVQDEEAISADGVYHNPGEGGNLPAGEVYIAPRNKQAFGKVVVDLSIKTIGGTTTINNPVSLYIEKGDIRSVQGGYEAKKLEKSFKWALKRAKTKWGIIRIGEFGIGLNDKAKPIGSTLIDEKVLGTAHVGIGSNYWFGGSVYAMTHLDQVFKEPIIKIDGRKINY